jgi:hypothetical protein
MTIITAQFSAGLSKQAMGDNRVATCTPRSRTRLQVSVRSEFGCPIVICSIPSVVGQQLGRHLPQAARLFGVHGVAGNRDRTPVGNLSLIAIDEVATADAIQ